MFREPAEPAAPAEPAEPAGTGGAGGASPVARPIGISVDIWRYKPEAPTSPASYHPRGLKWPPGKVSWWEESKPTSFDGYGTNTCKPILFPYGHWGPQHFAMAMLAEFAAVTRASEDDPHWLKVLSTSNHSADHFDTFPATIGYKNGSGKVDLKAELDELERLIEYRPGILAEAVAQRDVILPYFRGIAHFNRASHPATVYLCYAAERIAAFAVMHYKWTFKRPRPSQYRASLLPPIEVPGHAAYPSGHATHAHILADLLEYVILPQGHCYGDPAKPSPFRMMADRIARNREILGLHFPSDSAIGRKLATGCFGIMREMPTLKNHLLRVARSEWGQC